MVLRTFFPKPARICSAYVKVLPCFINLNRSSNKELPQKQPSKVLSTKLRGEYRQRWSRRKVGLAALV